MSEDPAKTQMSTTMTGTTQEPSCDSIAVMVMLAPLGSSWRQ